MFTGLVEEIGTVRRIWTVDGGMVLSVDAEQVLHDVKVSDSIAINGACLTVTEVSTSSFVVGVCVCVLLWVLFTDQEKKKKH